MRETATVFNSLARWTAKLPWTLNNCECYIGSWLVAAFFAPANENYAE